MEMIKKHLFSAYPSIQKFRVGNDLIRFETCIRIKRDGVWYDVNIADEYHCSVDGIERLKDKAILTKMYWQAPSVGCVSHIEPSNNQTDTEDDLLNDKHRIERVSSHLFLNHRTNKKLQNIHMNKLVENVINWAQDKQILKKENSFKQMAKVTEEVGEIASAIARDDMDLLEDGIGDGFVTLIILAKQNGLEPIQCLERAYNEIKNRKGKTIDGVFVKQEDL